MQSDFLKIYKKQQQHFESLKSLNVNVKVE